MPGNGVQAGSRRETVGSVSDDDSKMVICEDRPPETNADPSSNKTGKCEQASREPRRTSGYTLFLLIIENFIIFQVIVKTVILDSYRIKKILARFMG